MTIPPQKFTRGLILLVVLAAICGSVPATAGDESSAVTGAKPTCTCPAASGAWLVAPDSMEVPCELMEQVEVMRMFSCDCGVFFSFRAGDFGERQSWWLGVVPPTREQYEYCVQDELLETARELKLSKAVDEASVRYAEFRDEIEAFFGPEYREGTVVRFNRTYGRQPILEGVSTLSWHGDDITFGLMPNLYVHR